MQLISISLNNALIFVDHYTVDNFLPNPALLQYSLYVLQEPVDRTSVLDKSQNEVIAMQILQGA